MAVVASRGAAAAAGLAPPRDRVYADGSPAVGEPIDTNGVSGAEWRARVDAHRGRERRKLAANPPASIVHAAEAGAPWRRAGEAEVAADISRAQPELWAKRLKGLAQQTSRGLLSVYGLRYEMTTIWNMLDEAYKAKEKRRGASAGGDPGATGGSADASDDSVRLLEAVLRYDLRAVVRLLGLKMPDPHDKVLTG